MQPLPQGLAPTMPTPRTALLPSLPDSLSSPRHLPRASIPQRLCPDPGSALHTHRPVTLLPLLYTSVHFLACVSFCLLTGGGSPISDVLSGTSLVAQMERNLPAMQETRVRWFDPCVKRIPWRRELQPTPGFLPGEFHGQRRLAGYTSWGRKESDMTE